MHYTSDEYSGRMNGRGIVFRAREVLQTLQEEGIKPGTIVMQGVSGMTIGMVVAAKLGCNFVVVRKEDEDCHGYGTFVGEYGAKGPAVIVDDFVDSGDTLRRVADHVRAHCPPRKRVIAVMYGSDKDWRKTCDANVIEAGGTVETYGCDRFLASKVSE